MSEYIIVINLTNYFNFKQEFKNRISNIYNMSGRVVSDIQTRAESGWLYISYNTDAHVVYTVAYDYPTFKYSCLSKILKIQTIIAK